MNTKEMIEVMQAFEDGEVIECREDCQVSQWSSTDDPCWAWNMFDYRIKPKEISLEDLLRKAYPDHDCYVYGNDIKFLDHIDTGAQLSESAVEDNWKYIVSVPDGEPNQLCAYLWTAGLDYEAIIIPKQTMEDRVKAEYGDFDVVMTYWLDDYLYIKRVLIEFGHIHAQSMRNFCKYVYECKKTGRFYMLSTPIGHGSAHPIAVLFSRESK